MQRRLVVSFVFLAALCIAGYIVFAKVNKHTGTGFIASADSSASQGALQIINPEKGAVTGLCPLKHTDVKAEISGFLSRVVVTQEFENPYKDKIEAVYTFPLPHNAAVDDMTLRVGDRIVVVAGTLKGFLRHYLIGGCGRSRSEFEIARVQLVRLHSIDRQ